MVYISIGIKIFVICNKFLLYFCCLIYCKLIWNKDYFCYHDFDTLDSISKEKKSVENGDFL